MMIKCKLSTKSLDDAIKKIKLYKKQIDACTQALVGEAVELGAEQASALVVDRAVESGRWLLGDLENSIHSEHRGCEGKYYTANRHAAEVEFGTGVVGAANPYGELPDGVSWTYQTDPRNWKFYWKGDRYFHWTSGQAPKAYMRDSAQMLADNLPWFAQEVFSDLA